MINFGFSPYLKLAASNQKPANTQLLARTQPSSGGYDFHRRMREIAPRVALGMLSAQQLKDEINSVSRPAERKSLLEAISTLTRWAKGKNLGLVQTQHKWISQRAVFSVKFDAQLIWHHPTHGDVEMHLWNTKNPTILFDSAMASLGLFAGSFPDAKLAVLSLRDSSLFVCDDAERSETYANLRARDFERRIRLLLKGGAAIKRQLDGEVVTSLPF